MRILVVEARGLNVGFLGCYGNEWIATPHLDRVAAEGVVFDWHIHDRPDVNAEPRPALAGVLPVRLDRIADFGQAALAAWKQSSNDIVWLSGPDLAPPWELPDDLKGVYFDEESEGEPWTDPPTELAPTLTIPETIELQNTYAAAVTWFDAQVGVVLDGLRSTGEIEQTLLCITSNAGLPLGEHGEIGAARAWLHEERVHVPLLMRFPRKQHAGLRLGALTQPPDLPATMAALLGREAPSTSGQNLLPLIHGDVDSVRLQACSQLQADGNGEAALRTLDWTLLLPLHVPEGDEPRESQLYVKPDDRWEVNDVRQHHQELAEQFEQTLRAHLDQSAPSKSI